MDGLQSFSFIMELASIILFLVVLCYVFKIGKITGFFTAWNLIAAGFALIVLRRLISFIRPYVPHGGLLEDFVEPVVLLAITILFIIGFRKLIQAFEKQ